MLSCRGLGSPPRVPAKAQKCLEVSWEPQSKAVDQEEMCPGLGLHFDGQPGGRGCACHSSFHTDLP